MDHQPPHPPPQFPELTDPGGGFYCSDLGISLPPLGPKWNDDYRRRNPSPSADGAPGDE